MTSSTKKILCTFADHRLVRSLFRLKKQAEELDVFDSINIYTDEDLDPIFVNKYSQHLKFGSRGFGYYCWKPYVISKTMSAVGTGDLVLYLDAGNHLNKKGKKRLIEYFDKLQSSSKNVLATELDRQKLEKFWTKADLLEYLGVANNSSIINSPQLQSGIILLKKNTKSIELIDNWANIFSENFSLIDDSESVNPNHRGFVEHRHDQSAFSVLCKLYGFESISYEETYTDDDWSKLEDYPIWSKRDLKLSRFYRLKLLYERTFQQK
jgi:hypothetical protein